MGAEFPIPVDHENVFGQFFRTAPKRRHGHMIARFIDAVHTRSADPFLTAAGVEQFFAPHHRPDPALFQPIVNFDDIADVQIDGIFLFTPRPNKIRRARY